MTVVGHAGLHNTVGELLAGHMWWFLPLICLALALIFGRWSIILLPGLIWLSAAVFLKLNNGWHGFGWGDFGIEWNIVVALASGFAVTVGVVTHHVARRLLRRADYR